jgi:hypothetical protein
MLFLNNLKAIDCGLHMRHFGKETTVLMSRTAFLFAGLLPKGGSCRPLAFIVKF